MDEFQAQMFEVFAYETNDFLARLEQILLAAEQNPQLMAGQVHEIFRIMHTIKSSSAMMGFSRLSALAHGMENLFQFIRDFRPQNINTEEITDMLLACIDYMKQCIEKKAEPENSGRLPENIAACLKRLQEDALSQESACRIRVFFEENCDNASLRAFELVSRVKNLACPADISPREGDEKEEEKLRSSGLCLTFPTDESVPEIEAFIREQPFVAGVTVKRAVNSAVPKAFVTAAEKKLPDRRADGMLGVENQKLENLINLAGETVIASQAVAHLFDEGRQGELGPAIRRLHRSVLEIQNRALTLRMITLKDTFRTLKRSLRDMAKDLDREVCFTVSGEEISMDRNMVRHISGPLLHILRNAVEHGIEPRAERLAAGKSEAGTIRLSAGLSGKAAVISVEDDGRGIHPGRILETALQKQLITREQCSELSAEEIYSFLLMPGFSTQETVSEYSGRGVGLDVVNDSLRKIGGRLQIKSVPSKGSRFTLRIPLTLATMDAFLVRVGDEIYTIPVGSVCEVFSAERSAVREINGQDAVLQHDVCYAVWCLHEKPPGRQAYQDGIFIIMEHDNIEYAFFADEILEHQNVVVKPVPELLMQVPGILGCTVLGSGRVSLIIDDIILLMSREMTELL